MPQMSPINWLCLFFMFMILFFLFNILNYFSFNIINFYKKNNIIKNKILFNWKW
nr:ATP synthase F0 subunit 8 [Pseudolycoriella hygida]